MLTELRVQQLGVIADLGVVLGPGLIALTGETGAGKTLVVEAIELLLGGRADPVLVRPGAAEAVVEGRFTSADDDLVLTRVIPVAGRSRAYVNGRMATLSALDEAARDLIDLHGQHSHQSLLTAAAQRRGLDTFARVDLGPVADARRRQRAAGDALAALGGDAASRAREHDTLAFQVEEIDAAQLQQLDEDEVLADEEERLAHAASHREGAEQAVAALTNEGGVAEGLTAAIAAVAGHQPLEALHQRLRSAAIELDDAASDLRALAEGLEDDPQRRAWIRERRQLLRQLRRKYGATVADVLDYRDIAARRLAELDGFEQRAQQLEEARQEAGRDLAEAQAAVGRQRRAAAGRLAEAIEARLRDLAMPKATVEVQVGDDPAGEQVTWLLASNPGEPALPLAKVASGGELARTMLAVRLVLGPAGSDHSPVGEATAPTLVFDEVDAGIGGEAALAVGRALADLARRYQVLVVTHLPQVAAFADQQIAVRKEELHGRTVATVAGLDDGGRVVELSRMLSGQPDSPAARRHAEELLTLAARARGASAKSAPGSR
jgi:DNA repair protein RecN (Recombination protein N)